MYARVRVYTCVRTYARHIVGRVYVSVYAWEYVWGYGGCSSIFIVSARKIKNTLDSKRECFYSNLFEYFQSEQQGNNNSCKDVQFDKQP